MMTNFSQSVTSSFNATMGYNSTENPEKSNRSLVDYIILLLFIVSLLISFSGLVGNGKVIWLLGFRVKKNPFTTYILSLSIADFLVLTVLVPINILFIIYLFESIFLHFLLYLCLWLESIFLATFTASQFLLTVISIDRCVCIFFPLWHRCHRPTHLSTAVCVVIWIFAFLIFATDITLKVSFHYTELLSYLFAFNTVLSMPIMCVSTTAILIKICLNLQLKKQGKLIRATLLTLVFFILFAFPVNVYYILIFLKLQSSEFAVYVYLCLSLNSTINPIIYYFVGRGKRGKFSKGINNVLEKLFKEEEDYREPQETTTETEL
nr:proto-oncogene Mas-like [Anolis sagrei ordinatus]